MPLNRPPPREKSRRIAKEDPIDPGPLPQSKRRRLKEPTRDESGRKGPDALSSLSTLTTASSDEWVKLAADAKAKIKSYSPIPGKRDEKLPNLLNALIDLLPAGGRDSIAHDIMKCSTDTELFEVYNDLYTALLLPMKVAGQKNLLTGSSHLKGHLQVETVAEGLSASSTRSETLCRDCLLRDNYRCVIRGHLSLSRWNELGRPEGERIANLKVAHIIPYAYASYKDANSPSVSASDMWRLLYRCFPDVREIGMDSTMINDASNAIMMCSHFHEGFGDFSLALMPTEDPDVYRLKKYAELPYDISLILNDNQEVKLRRATEDVPMPNPIFLNVHFLLAEILHASGMGETIDKHIRDVEDIGCLREDGSTDIASLLTTALCTVMG